MLELVEVTSKNSTTPLAVPGTEVRWDATRVRTQGGEQAENSYHFQLAFGDPADAVGSKVGVPCLDTPEAAEILITLFLPLCNQVFVSVSFLDAVLIELCRGADSITCSSREVLGDSPSGITTSTS